MNFDISTPETRQKALCTYRQHLRTELEAAIYMHDHLHGDDRQKALDAVAGLERIRLRIYRKAEALGYAAGCVRDIPDCKGECCKWHFPKDIDRTDLFISLCSLPEEGRAALHSCLDSIPPRYQCPFLKPDGCLFSFSARPLVCANAYPCFLGNEYYAFLQAQKTEINALRQAIQNAQKSIRL